MFRPLCASEAACVAAGAPDQNGVLDMKEFLLGFSFWREKLSSSSDKCLFAFTLFDRDKSGRMDCEEFEQVVKYMLKVSSEKSLTALAEACKADIEAFVTKAFQAADADGSGFIDIDELLQWLKVRICACWCALL